MFMEWGVILDDESMKILILVITIILITILILFLIGV